MSTTHTPGRILFRENGEDNQHAMLTEDGRLMLALLAPRLSISPGPHSANFRRLAACWNACEGISTEALETGPTMMAAHQREQDRADKAERELENLRAALGAIAAGNSDPDSMVELAQQALAEPTEAAAPCKRTVTIPACEGHEGIESVALTLLWRCIHCGGPRGEPTIGTSWDGSRQLAVHTWTNPCGHTEKYSQLREWANAKQCGTPAPALRR